MKMQSVGLLYNDNPQKRRRFRDRSFTICFTFNTLDSRISFDKGIGSGNAGAKVMIVTLRICVLLLAGFSLVVGFLPSKTEAQDIQPQYVSAYIGGTFILHGTEGALEYQWYKED